MKYEIDVCVRWCGLAHNYICLYVDGWILSLCDSPSEKFQQPAVLDEKVVQSMNIDTWFACGLIVTLSMQLEDHDYLHEASAHEQH